MKLSSVSYILMNTFFFSGATKKVFINAKAKGTAAPENAMVDAKGDICGTATVPDLVITSTTTRPTSQVVITAQATGAPQLGAGKRTGNNNGIEADYVLCFHTAIQITTA